MRMAKTLTKLERILNHLEKRYGPPDALPVTDPLEIILFDTVVYLAGGEKRCGCICSAEEARWPATGKDFGRA